MLVAPLSEGPEFDPPTEEQAYEIMLRFADGLETDGVEMTVTPSKDTEGPYTPEQKIAITAIINDHIKEHIRAKFSKALEQGSQHTTNFDTLTKFPDNPPQEEISEAQTKRMEFFLAMETQNSPSLAENRIKDSYLTPSLLREIKAAVSAASRWTDDYSDLKNRWRPTLPENTENLN